MKSENRITIKMSDVNNCKLCGRPIIKVKTNLDHRLYVDFESMDMVTTGINPLEVFARNKHRNTCPERAIYQEKNRYGEEY